MKLVDFAEVVKIEKGIPMCQPIEFGTCDEGVYSLQSWIDGVDAEESVKTLSDAEVYKYGYEAGGILKKLHSIEAPEGIGDWEPFFNQKMNRKIENYKSCPLKYENGDAFITYIEEFGVHRLPLCLPKEWQMIF